MPKYLKRFEFLPRDLSDKAWESYSSTDPNPVFKISYDCGQYRVPLWWGNDSSYYLYDGYGGATRYAEELPTINDVNAYWEVMADENARLDAEDAKREAEHDHAR